MNRTLIEMASLAEEAGRAIMKIYNKPEVATSEKEDRSPLTEADLAANAIITEALALFDPPSPVLSEESKEIPYEVRRDWKRYWLVDPLDGTKEFLKRNGEFTVNIALIVDNRPVAGVVAAPAVGLTYFAAQGEGAWRRRKHREPEKISVKDCGDGPVKVVASRSHRGEEVDALLGRLPLPYDVVSCGSSLKICKVAEGEAHLYPRLGPTSEWDIAAAHIVLEEAGGIMTTVEGAPLEYNKENILNPYFIASAPLPFELKL